MDNPIDPALFERDDLRAVLARHDIDALYRALHEAGISQRQIAQRTGQAQSEVSEILKALAGWTTTGSWSAFAKDSASPASGWD